MITLVRWYILKAKEVKMKLTFYKIAEKVLKETAKMDAEDWADKFVSAFIEVLHKNDDK